MNTLEKAIQATKNKTNTPTPTPTPIPMWDKIRALEKDLSIAIKKERNLQGISQRELAKRSETTQSSITRAEKGLYISITMLMKITSGLNKKLIIN